MATSVFGQKHGSLVSLPSSDIIFPINKVSCFPLTSLHVKPAKLFHLKAAPAYLTSDDQENVRKFKKLPTSEWTHHFHSLTIDVQEMDALRKEVDALKPKVKKTLMSSQGIDSTKKSVLMIYLLVSLGLAFHFEDEIFETLKEGFENIEEMMSGEEDLYTVSIIFWVFRRYGYYMSSDVFRRFKGSNGNFKESLIEDVKGMLSLYEAAYLGTTKEYIMDEALSFTSSHLESFAASETCPPHLSSRIKNALNLSQHWNMEMLVTVEYISFYEQEKDYDEMLLRLAKLNFNLLQLQYRQELKILRASPLGEPHFGKLIRDTNGGGLTKWYKDLEFASKLPPYFRDRITENYFFVLGPFFEPQVSCARIMLNQYFTVITLHDDTYDRYASLPEAKSLSNSLKRWAPDHDMDKQPYYLNFVLNFILDTFQDLERELRPQGRSYSVNATIEEFKLLAKANLDLAEWALAAHVPSFEEYMEVGEVEITVCATLAGIFMSMGKIATNKAFKWLKSRPKMVKSLCIKVRLMNDIAGFEDDMSRGHVTNAVKCYMKQYGVDKEDALKELNKMVVEADKIMNEEFLTTTCVPYCVLKGTLDVTRMACVSYYQSEGFTNPQGKTKEYMTSMFLHQFHL